MNLDIWTEVKQPAHDERIWELYHENSKIGAFYRKKLTVIEREDYSKRIITSLPVSAKHVIKLETNPKTTAQRFTINELAFLIQNSTHETTDNNLISPLEIYLQLDNLSACDNGLYHYDQNKKELQFIDSRLLEVGFELSRHKSRTSIVIYITAVFNRLVTIYGETGYRMCLIEVGKLIQRLGDSCKVLQIKCNELEEVSERSIEKYLDIDGINQSIVSSVILNKQ